MIPFNLTPYCSGKPTNLVRFVELICNYRLEENREKDFKLRLERIIQKTGVPESVMEQEDTKDLIHAYLSYYQYHNKYQALLGKQIQLWNLQRFILDDFTMEDVKVRVDMNKWSDELTEQVEALYSEIYGPTEIQAIAQEKVQVAMTPEARLRRNKQQKE